jgi:DNA-binding NtrC family response regulator
VTEVTNIGDAVLFADDDTFQIAYVGSALTAAGHTFIGPIRSSDGVRDLIAGGATPRAVVLASWLADGPSWQLVEELRAREISHLVLICPSERETDFGATSVLKKPFAAYQVVEWVARQGQT